MKNLIKTQNLNKYNILNKNIVDVIDEFLNQYNNIQTKRRYNRILLNFVDFLEIESLNDLWIFHFSQLNTYCIDFINLYKKFDDENKKRIINNSTINNVAYILRSFFNYIIFNYNYPKNPLWNYKPLKMKENSTTPSLDRMELINILNHLKIQFLNEKEDKWQYIKLRNYLIFCFLSLSLRRNEIVNLKWEDLNTNNNYINVEQKWWTFKQLPLLNWVTDYLMILKQIKNNLNLNSSYILTPFINNTTKTLNKPLNSSFLVKLINNVCNELSIDKEITPHSFRKTFIELSLDKNENYNNIMNATWHKTSQLMRYYDNRDKLKNNAINNFNDIF